MTTATETRLIWTREVFGSSRKYSSECGRYNICYYRILSSRPNYTLYDANGNYIATFWHLEFAKKNADRHAATGRIIGQGLRLPS